jgi:hypothetical protein
MYFPGLQLEIYSSVVSPTWEIEGKITSFFFHPLLLLVCDMFIHFHHFSKTFSKTLPTIWRGSNSKHSAGIGAATPGSITKSRTTFDVIIRRSGFMGRSASSVEFSSRRCF